jgi:hypothetical protein
MTNLKYQDILSFARDRVKDQANMKKALSVALGIALSRKIQVPSGEVEDGYVYYSDTVSHAVLSEAVMFNENLIVDLDMVEQTARAFWLIRYFNAHPLPCIPLVSEDEGHFMNKLAGCGHLINPDTFNMCQDEASTIIVMVNKIREIIG